jgi:GNAT superfamily N-acetyltransferase
MKEFTLTAAVPSQAEQIVGVLRRSISIVCGPAYRNNHAIISGWLENKTVGNILSWMSDPKNRMLVLCDEEALVAGVGLGRINAPQGGEILLCYLDPTVVGKGYGTTLLCGIENFLRQNGAVQFTVNSTVNALNFYLRNGYTPRNIVTAPPAHVELSKAA